MDDDWRPESTYDAAMRKLAENPLMKWYAIRESVKNGPLGFVFELGFDVADFGVVGGETVLGFERQMPQELLADLAVAGMPMILEATWDVSVAGGGLDAGPDDPVWVASIQLVTVEGVASSTVLSPTALDELLQVYERLPLPTRTNIEDPDIGQFSTWQEVFDHELVETPCP